MLIYLIYTSIKTITPFDLKEKLGLIFAFTIIFFIGVSYSVSAGLWGAHYDYRRFIIPIIPAILISLSSMYYSKYKKILIVFMIIAVITIPIGLIKLKDQTENLSNVKNQWIYVNSKVINKEIFGITNAGISRYFLNENIRVYDLIGLNHYQVIGKDRLAYSIEKNITYLENLWFKQYLLLDNSFNLIKIGNKELYKVDTKTIDSNFINEYDAKFRNANFSTRLKVWFKRAG